MQEYINTLRSKDADYKHRVLYIVVGVVTFLLIAGWIAGLSTMDKLVKKDDTGDKESNGPIAIMTESFGRIWDKAKSGGWEEDDSTNTEVEESINIEQTEIPFGQQIQIGNNGTTLNEGTN